VVGGLEYAVWPFDRIGSVVEAAVGKRTTEALVEEQEQERDVNTLGGQAVGIASAITLEQSKWRLKMKFRQYSTCLIE
jgi:hypothetical protein